MKIVNFSNKIIEFSFYGIFLLVPLVFSSKTSELFEFNKMWLTFALTILILSAWIIKMVILKKIWVQKTPLDIPIALFLISQIISTILSMDVHTSIWGYYSRFNGGLLSTLSYIILYYSFVSNFSLSDKLNNLRSSVSALTMVKRILGISLISGAIVALWGLPSHFGYDPTCFIFKGSFDVSCWTADFQPKIRIFSTLGQPAWLGAYLAILIPLLFAFFLNLREKKYSFGFLLLAILFYLDLLFTKSRAALIAIWISLFIFVVFYHWSKLRKFPLLYHRPDTWIFRIILGLWLVVNKSTTHFRFILGTIIVFLILTFVVLYPIELKGGKVQTTKIQTPTGSFSSGGGGTESGQIRLLVWKGALTAWTHYPIFGTGVETFAFAYYKYRPVEHNLTSEWNYLYNKAHNEYLNYLTTTGIVGLGSYLAIIGLFFYKMFFFLRKRKFDPLIYGILAGYLSILITNFFGFSVVIINLYFFLIPALVFILAGMIKEKNVFVYNFGKSEETFKLSLVQKIDIFVILLVTLYLLGGLLNFWLADKAYALGSNSSNSSQYEQAYLNLQEAVQRADFEPTFKDALASNDSILAISLLSNPPQDQKEASATANLAQSLAREAIIATTQTTNDHPNNVVFWKTKVRVFYTLSQVDPKYLSFALDAIRKAQTLAPTDANVSYNLGLLYGQSGDTKKAVDTLNQTIKLKPNYINAYYALGLFYRQLATNDKDIVINSDYNQKAIAQMEYILKKLDPENPEAIQALKSWGVTQ